MSKLVLRDSIYIPVKDVSDEDVAKHYVKHFYEERICRTCPEKKHRFSDACANCELGGHLGTVNLVKKQIFNGQHCYGVPIGDRLNVERKLGIDFDDYKIVDKRTKVAIDKRIKFLSPLRDYQVTIQKEWMTAKHGIIKAPPRSGKTITSLSICIALGQRFAIIADQKDFLDNFKEELEQHSNILRIQEKAGKPIYGFLKTKEDFFNYQIGFVTYQSFISDKNGKKKLKWLNENFGTIWTDECFTGEHRVKTEIGLVTLADIIEGKVKPKTVLSKNIKTGKREYKRIESFTKKQVQELCIITTDIGQIKCTPTHLIWSNTRNNYVMAKDLTSDDDLDLSK